MLMIAKGIITMGNIAKLILKCTDTFYTKKNWNSHGATVGSAICQLASILSQMPAASVNEHNHNFNVLIPQGNKQMGSKHGHHNVCYTQYMCSKYEPRAMGNLEMYLNLDIFRRDNHAAKVKNCLRRQYLAIPMLLLEGLWEHTPLISTVHTMGHVFLMASARQVLQMQKLVSWYCIQQNSW